MVPIKHISYWIMENQWQDSERWWFQYWQQSINDSVNTPMLAHHWLHHVFMSLNRAVSHTVPFMLVACLTICRLLQMIALCCIHFTERVQLTWSEVVNFLPTIGDNEIFLNHSKHSDPVWKLVRQSIDSQNVPIQASGCWVELFTQGMFFIWFGIFSLLSFALFALAMIIFSLFLSIIRITASLTSLLCTQK